MGKFIDLTDRTFGKLTVIEQGPRTDKGRIRWWCKCSCNNPELQLVITGSLTSQNTQSCGCLRLENVRKGKRTEKSDHGPVKNHPIYACWVSMRQRCLNPDCKEYKYYGGRGITICDRWMQFSNFVEDMYPTYEKGLTLERKEVNSSYCPENCTWITRLEQQSNKTTTIRVQLGEELISLKEACRRKGLEYKTVYARVKYLDWSIDRALEM